MERNTDLWVKRSKEEAGPHRFEFLTLTHLWEQSKALSWQGILRFHLQPAGSLYIIHFKTVKDSKESGSRKKSVFIRLSFYCPRRKLFSPILKNPNEWLNTVLPFPPHPSTPAPPLENPRKTKEKKILFPLIFHSIQKLIKEVVWLLRRQILELGEVQIHALLFSPYL